MKFFIVLLLLGCIFSLVLFSIKFNPKKSPTTEIIPINSTIIPTQAIVPTSTSKFVTATKTPIATPTPKPDTIVPPTSKPEPTVPAYKSITVSGYAYEDRNDDGQFNSDDVKLPNMQFYLYDSYDSTQQLSTVYSTGDGNFSITLQVKSGIIVKPTATNNFSPKTPQKTYTTSNNSLAFGFRSSSAPVPGNNSGIIEGNIYQDTNKNLTRNDGESSVYFYKLYLIDSKGNYYNTVENAQTTDAGGHFKYQNLPAPETYTISLSNPTGEYEILVPETKISLTSTSTQNTNVQIPVYKY